MNINDILEFLATSHVPFMFRSWRNKQEAVTSAVFAWIRTFVWYILVRLAIISLVELSILSAMMVMPIFGPIWMMGVWLAPIFPLY